jgi:hypothetical protein
MAVDAETSRNTTPAELAAAYEAIVGLGDSGDLGEQAARLRAEFQKRTGAFGPEDPWFEARARAFWDDALTTSAFGLLAAQRLPPGVRAIAQCLRRSHRGFFLVDDSDDRFASLIDLWSGAELLVRHLDETQALTLEHADGAMDARVTACPSGSDLFLLPGAYHHAPEALAPATEVLVAARERGLSTGETLDALMRMDLVLRASSRVKAAFAYRAVALPQAKSSSPDDRSR